MDLLTWTRKGKDSNIYYIYIHIYILIGILPKSQKSGEFVGTFLLLLLLLLLLTTTTVVVIVFVCVCVCYPCKQFVVVTIRRTGSWNTIPTYLTLPYLTHLFLSDSDKIYRDSSSIHRLVSRKNDYSGRQTRPPSEQISNLPENSLESITVQIQFSKYSRRALERHFHSGGGCFYYPKSRAQTKQNISIFKEEVHFFTIKPSYQYQEEEGEDKKQQQQQQHQNHDPPPHGFHPINLLLLLHHHYYQPFRNHHQKIPPKSLSRRNGNHSL